MGLRNLGLLVSFKGIRYDARAYIESVEVLSLSTKTGLKEIFAKKGDGNFVEAKVLQLLSKRREVTNNIQKMDFTVAPIAVNVNRAAIVDLINFIGGIKSCIPTSSKSAGCSLPDKRSDAIRY